MSVPKLEWAKACCCSAIPSILTAESDPIAELTHKRRVTSLGPGGLNRQNAGVDPRDVHHSHYGKICPIETPEGQDIGLLSKLATTASLDRHGFLTTPVRRLKMHVMNTDADLLGRELRRDLPLGRGYGKSGGSRNAVVTEGARRAA